MKDLLEDAAHRAIAYLEGLPARRVAPSEEALAALGGLERPWPQQPQPPRETLRLLDELGSPASMGMASGRFFGFVVGGALPVTVASNWLATAWDQNSGHYASTPGTAVIEQVALRWLLEALALPAGTAGAFVTGATMANCSALAAARHAVLERAGWDVEGEGLFGAPPITVVLGDVLNQVLASFGDDATTRRVVAGLQAEGTCWCGITVWQGHTAMRISVCSWATTDDDVTRALDAIRRVMRQAPAASGTA